MDEDKEKPSATILPFWESAAAKRHSRYGHIVGHEPESCPVISFWDSAAAQRHSRYGVLDLAAFTAMMSDPAHITSELTRIYEICRDCYPPNVVSLLDHDCEIEIIDCTYDFDAQTCVPRVQSPSSPSQDKREPCSILPFWDSAAAKRHSRYGMVDAKQDPAFARDDATLSHYLYLNAWFTGYGYPDNVFSFNARIPAHLMFIDVGQPRPPR